MVGNAQRPPGRFEALFQLIPSQTRVIADIGYDHGKMLTRVVSAYPDVSAIGVELQSEAADRFWKVDAPDLPEERSRIELRTGDGLLPLQPGEADTLLIAGVGEMTTNRILEEGSDHLKGTKHLVFMPSHSVVHLRYIFKRYGYITTDECIAYERKRYYLGVQAEKASGASEPQGWKWRYAPILFERKDPLLFAYLKQVKTFFRDRIEFADRQPEAMREYCLGIDRAIDEARKFAG